MSAVLDWILAHPEAIVAAIVAVFSMVKGNGWLQVQLADKRWQRIRSFALIAFHAVEEADRLATGSLVLDGVAKTLLFIEKIDNQLEGAGDPKLTPAERIYVGSVLSPGIHAAAENISPPLLAPQH